MVIFPANVSTPRLYDGRMSQPEDSPSFRVMSKDIGSLWDVTSSLENSSFLKLIAKNQTRIYNLVT